MKTMKTMKTIKIASIALVPPISAATATIVGAFGPKMDIWGLGSALLIIVVGVPLIVGAPVSSLIGLCCSAYARSRAEDRTTPTTLLILNGILLIIGSITLAYCLAHKP